MNSETFGDAPPGSAPDRVRGRAVAAAVAAMAVLVAVTIGARSQSGVVGAVMAADIAAGAAGCALLPVVARRPVPGALALAVLAALSPAATPPATLGALWAAERRRFPVAAALAAAGVAGHAVQGLWRPSGGISYAWWLGLITVAYGALVGWGALARARRALLASLRERAARAEAEQGRRVAEARMLERTRIAREMHDVLAHRLSLLATYAGALEYRPDAPPEKLARAAGVVRAGAHQALDELREVILLLRSDDDGAGEGNGGVGGRPQPVLADLPRLVAESRDAGGLVRLSDRVVDPGALPAAAGRTAYRVVQEGLTNARKHAAGQPVEVALEGRPGGRLEIDISNPLPDPAAPGPAVPGSGTGLVGLTERVRLAGGRLDHGTAAGEFRVRAWLPWPA
ncbi:sensor histidine kinase [Actinomadura terrae]|uniref:sensor histidine kinase n=1 Tax=Actinomadura terrae TaxID=604353 RepID=UPI001FA6B15D|nr:histidine kinase [Actinomadura terrae]